MTVSTYIRNHSSTLLELVFMLGERFIVMFCSCWLLYAVNGKKGSKTRWCLKDWLTHRGLIHLADGQVSFIRNIGIYFCIRCFEVVIANYIIWFLETSEVIVQLVHTHVLQWEGNLVNVRGIPTYTRASCYYLMERYQMPYSALMKANAHDYFSCLQRNEVLCDHFCSWIDLAWQRRAHVLGVYMWYCLAEWWFTYPR